MHYKKFQRKFLMAATQNLLVYLDERRESFGPKLRFLVNKSAAVSVVWSSAHREIINPGYIIEVSIYPYAEYFCKRQLEFALI